MVLILLLIFHFSCLFPDFSGQFQLLLLLYSFKSFSHQSKMMVFHGSLSDSKSPQVSRILLHILANLNNVVIWMVSTCSLIFKFSSPFIILLVTVPSAPITFGITISFLFDSFFCFLARFRYFYFFLLSFSFTLRSIRMAKSTIWQVLFFCWPSG